MEELTKKQLLVLQYIKDYMADNHYPPTHREIMARFRYKNTKSVFDHLKALEKKGYIRKNPFESRAIEVVEFDPDKQQEIPVLGDIAAGMPITAQQNYEESLVLADIVPSADREFFLRVKGDSMSGAHIGNGDLALIRPQAVPDYNGQIVAALIDNDATLKYYYKKDRLIELRPDNPAYESIVYRASDPVNISIIGVLVSIVRNY